MPPPPPLSVVEWRDFLRSYSSEFLNSEYLRQADEDGFRERPLVTESQRRARWLGSEPTSEEAITAAELRLGVRLPPTYRNFLLASNGFSRMSYSLDLLKAEQIEWFSTAEPDLLDAWSAPDFAAWITTLERCLLVSDDNGGAGGRWLLHTGNAENREWTAYEWWPGYGVDPEPYDNFAVLVTSLWRKSTKL
ncbi:SMI1/KNR4 family protein [Streptomyces sp. WMMC500]|uniref:SMI1/KNR4 family protein n=1 Tax=Streptomyces sp. WMMC500 TaxID=3015154 RepID=UPI00248B56DF|nr:SMI1/KNR4 family protein [Streptomyces sp. WMMC500]WBB62049.1 SMI1/KNR4 family protein [Streptomyces sp. WMMC500]